ncbi:hypothetical protein [Ramlibacter sp. PS4R-6]|uniref:hypothetical protein n=1 Tax=Ramlibacter sp. PS4R-6 TaxID=3133438 RepID=UPI00309776C2
MVLKWFDTAEVDRFADSIVNLFTGRFPPTEFNTPARKSEERFRKVHAALAREVTEFRASHSLNVYQKARLANRFRWALKDAGYPDAFIDEFTTELAAIVAQR